tara:strand:- start:2826 stop:3530 length:705 start_codon:yes stop_codon:yes gene_type:complete
MQKKVKGILIKKKIIKENNLYIRILTEHDEILTGIVYGGNSSKNKSIYQNGYFLNFIVNNNNRNKPNSIISEIAYPLIGNIINDKYKLQCLASVISIINQSIIEGQNIKNIYFILEDFISIITSNNKWLIFYFIFLFNLLKVIGYQVDYLSNEKNKYFDLNSLEFSNIKKNNSILFPFNQILNKDKIDYRSVEDLFIVFEAVFKNNHLINMNLKLPINFIKFKKLILDYLKYKK